MSYVVPPLTHVLSAIGKLQALPAGSHVPPHEYNEYLLDALRIDPATIPADVAEWAAGLASQLPPGVNGALVAAYLAGKEYRAVGADTLIVAYAVALLVVPSGLIGALDTIARLTAPPVVDLGDVDPTPDTLPTQE